MRSAKAIGAAQAALREYVRELDGDDLARRDQQEVITDLLADLMHYCEIAAGPDDEFDFGHALSSAEGHYEAEAEPNVWVTVLNAYADGHESAVSVCVPHPFPVSYEDTSVSPEWWDLAVFPFTGDGHGGPASYTATIAKADREDLVGLTHEWSD